LLDFKDIFKFCCRYENFVGCFSCQGRNSKLIMHWFFHNGLQWELVLGGSVDYCFGQHGKILVVWVSWNGLCVNRFAAGRCICNWVQPDSSGILVASQILCPFDTGKKGDLLMFHLFIWPLLACDIGRDPVV
jgi:hypothetical protein